MNTETKQRLKNLVKKARGEKSQRALQQVMAYLDGSPLSELDITTETMTTLKLKNGY